MIKLQQEKQCIAFAVATVMGAEANDATFSLWGGKKLPVHYVDGEVATVFSDDDLPLRAVGYGLTLKIECTESAALAIAELIAKLNKGSEP